MRAILKPRYQSPHSDEITVDMLARTSNGRVKVQGINPGAAVFAVDRWRLHSESERGRRLSDREIDSLPWQGKGVDPLTLSDRELFQHLEEVPR
jgi:hypothetical protein